jgi:hypothetical protein
MSARGDLALAPIFLAVGDVLAENRAVLNQADLYNGNHGDHMVAIFETATLAAQEKSGMALAEAMAYAGEQLAQLEGNGSAQVYARGLISVAEQLGKRDITLEELVAYVAAVLHEEDEPTGSTFGAHKQPERSGEVLKALVAGIAAWNRQEAGAPPGGGALSMGALFDFGIAYLQAKQRGGSQINVLANTAAAISPLGSIPHRAESGKLVMIALLQALKAQAGGLPGTG